MPDRRRWLGLASAVTVVILTLWAAADGTLGLYIAPRSYAFTVTLAIVGAVGIGAAIAITGRDHPHPPAPATPLRQWMTTLSPVAVVAALLLLAGTPSTTLSASTAAHRTIDNAGASIASDPASVAVADRTVKDWVAAIRSDDDPTALEGASTQLTGFVTPAGDSTPDDFYVTRFLITCCAVDAQPIGVLIRSAGWQTAFPAGSWVTVDGSFAANADLESPEAVVLIPTTIRATPEPKDPYVY